MEAVRVGRTADAARCAELAAEAIAGVAGRRGGAMLVAREAPDPRVLTASRFAALMDAPGWLVLVGTLSGAVTGWSVCHVETLLAGDRVVGRLDGLYVEPGARGMGLGRLLLDAAVAWLAEQGCSGVDGAALPGDREVKSLFEQAGFKARLLTMYRDIP